MDDSYDDLNQQEYGKQQQSNRYVENQQDQDQDLRQVADQTLG